MPFLHRIRSRRAFPLPHFEVVPLEFEEESELLLETAARANAPDARVVLLPTAGELHATIHKHLRVSRANPPVDAVEELRNALSDLRGSLG